ncbi:MAG: hypothetical protein V7K69_20335 [Nostoc sp.]|uniref:hypothetical protein n=1 Tax=Nostoc sp. TaxID=1180 RepID=UPI002FF7C669
MLPLQRQNLYKTAIVSFTVRGTGEAQKSWLPNLPRACTSTCLPREATPEAMDR